MATATADLDLYAHLMRRAGFGARLDELEVLASRPYEDVVEDLLHPERFPDVEIDMIERFYSTGNAGYGPIWWSRMFNSRRQLEEKMTLFWHHIFATGQSKSAHNPSAQAQINMFRRLGMTDIRTLLLELSKDPAMIFWLDNNENLKDEPNENYGVSCSNSSPWESGTTRRRTSRPPPTPSPAGRWRPLFRGREADTAATIPNSCS